MTASEILVPIGEGAPASASEQVRRWSKLFGAHSLSDRLALIRSSGLDVDSLNGPYAEPVRNSLTLGTVVEVALRLIDMDLAESDAAQVDALASLMRVSQGVVERRELVDSSVKDKLLGATSHMLQARPEWAPILDLWNAGMHVYSSEANSLWSSENVHDVGISQPLHLSICAAAALCNDPPEWALSLSSDYAMLNWLSKDLLSLTLDHPTTRIIGPMSNVLYRDGELDASHPLMMECVHLLNVTAEHMHLTVETCEAQLPTDVREYAMTTLRFAGVAYSRCLSRGLA